MSTIFSSDIIPICEECKAKDFKDGIKTCAKCGIAYCEHFSSVIDVRFCGNCMVDFKVTQSTEIRTTESTNAVGEVIYKKRAICKRLHLEGTDWLFSANKISTLSDEELDATIEYHKAIAGLMLSEREDRRVEKYQQLNKMVVKLSLNRDDVDATGAIKGSLKTPKQKAESLGTKKTTKTTSKKMSDADTLAAAMQTLLKSGLSKEQLAAFIGGKR